jgi:hypothetical protein
MEGGEDGCHASRFDYMSLRLKSSLLLSFFKKRKFMLLAQAKLAKVKFKAQFAPVYNKVRR